MLQRSRVIEGPMLGESFVEVGAGARLDGANEQGYAG
jgi:hypothetical protein